MRPTQGDFYRWLEKDRKGAWRIWTPEKWHPEDSDFSKDCEGWEQFIDECQADCPGSYIEELLDEFSQKVDLRDFHAACTEAAKKFIEGGWRKACLSALSLQDERELTEMMSFLRKWHGIEGTVSFFAKDSRELENVHLLDVPDHAPLIPSRSYAVKNGWGYALPRLLREDFGTYFWVKFNEPKSIPKAKFAFQDGVLMAVPENLLPESCQKLLGLFQRKGGEKR